MPLEEKDCDQEDFDVAFDNITKSLGFPSHLDYSELKEMAAAFCKKQLSEDQVNDYVKAQQEKFSKEIHDKFMLEIKEVIEKYESQVAHPLLLMDAILSYSIHITYDFVSSHFPDRKTAFADIEAKLHRIATHCAKEYA